MGIRFNPNLPANDAPDNELIAQKLGGLMLGDPDAFEEPPTDESVGASWNAEVWDSIFDAGEEEEEA